MTIHGANDFPGLGVPDFDRAVIAAGCDASSIGTDVEAHHATRMSTKCPEFLPGHRVPQFDRGVTVSRDHTLAIRRERDGVSSAGVSVTRDVASLKSPFCVIPFEGVAILRRNFVQQTTSVHRTIGIEPRQCQLKCGVGFSIAGSLSFSGGPGFCRECPLCFSSSLCLCLDRASFAGFCFGFFSERHLFTGHGFTAFLVGFASFVLCDLSLFVRLNQPVTRTRNANDQRDTDGDHRCHESSIPSSKFP